MEIAVLGCHEDDDSAAPVLEKPDDPEALALAMHQLRQAPDYAAALSLPPPLHLAADTPAGNHIKSFGGRMSQEPQFVSCVKGCMSCLVLLMILIVIGSLAVQSIGVGGEGPSGVGQVAGVRLALAHGVA
ncbi:RNaseH domain-containing protein [Streptomyces sp. NPDC003710]